MLVSVVNLFSQLVSCRQIAYNQLSNIPEHVWQENRVKYKCGTISQLGCQDKQTINVTALNQLSKTLKS